ncbi:ester cyclase [Flavobacteriaceae bacterium]|nr:ester cyclase [Flavobacteriaceae bacterium]
MKKILLLALVISMTNCKIESKKDSIVDANYQVEKDIEMYINLWDAFIYNRDTSVINSQYFTEDCIVVTAQGDIVGIEAVKEYYANYLNAFTEIEWEIKETFGQGNKLIKHYNFKGKHTGDFFGIPASGNYLDLSATTIVTMRDGRIAKEHDFYNMQAILDQLMKSKGDIVIDEQKSIN